MGQKVNLLKTNFAAGEVSPLMHGRVDTTRHKNGAAELLNFVVQPHGGVVRRTGTKFLYKWDNKRILVPFQFSNDESYLLEFYQFGIRVYKNDELILVGGFPLLVVSPYLEQHLEELSFCQSADVLYITHPNYYPRTLARYADNNWVLGLMEHEDGPYRSQVPADREVTLRLTDITPRGVITSTAPEFVVGDVGKFVEYYDEGYLVLAEIKAYVDEYSVSVEPKDNVVNVQDLDPQAVIQVSGNKMCSSLAIWSAETEYCYFKLNGVWYYLTTHDTALVVISNVSHDAMSMGTAPTVKTTTGFLSLTNKIITATLQASDLIFDSNRDVLRHMRLSFGSKNVGLWITSVMSPLYCNVRLGSSMPRDPRNQAAYLSNATTNNWLFGAWHVNNYPALCTIHQQRLILANCPTEKNRVWMSMASDYVSFSTANSDAEVLDSSGLVFSVESGELNPITWLQSGPVLLIGTAGEEFQVKPSSISEALTPKNIQITQQSAHGGKAHIRPLKIGSATIFVQRHGFQLREMMYNFEIDSFVASDLTIISEHILRENGGAKQMVFQQVPYGILWILCNNGKLVSLTYEKEHQVFAWAKHEITGTVISIAVLPSSDQHDDIYVVVKRTLDPQDPWSTYYYVEKFAKMFQPLSETDYAGMVFLDSYKEISSETPFTTITGLSHLEGQEVRVLTDYYSHPVRTVSSGQITLQNAVTHAYVGLNYTSRLKTLPEEGGSPVGTSQGKLKKLDRVDALLKDTIGLKFGVKEPSENTPMSFAGTSPVLGQPPKLFTGYKELKDDSGFSKNLQFYIVQDQPYPLNILSLSQIVVVNE